MLHPPILQIVRRAAHWRCPNCGEGRLFRGVFRMYPRCSVCGLSYFPEQGYYVGAMIINYAVTTAIIVTLYLLSLLLPDVKSISTNEKILLWMLFAVIMSLLLTRHSYSFWLGLDFWVKPRIPEPSAKSDA